MRGEYDRIQKQGAEVVTIGTGNVDYARAFVRDEDIPFPVLVDDDALAARAASIERVSVFGLFAPESFPGGLRAFKAGHRIGMPDIVKIELALSTQNSYSSVSWNPSSKPASSASQSPQP